MHTMYLLILQHAHVVFLIVNIVIDAIYCWYLLFFLQFNHINCSLFTLITFISSKWSTFIYIYILLLHRIESFMHSSLSQRWSFLFFGLNVETETATKIEFNSNTMQKYWIWYLINRKMYKSKKIGTHTFNIKYLKN